MDTLGKGKRTGETNADSPFWQKERKKHDSDLDKLLLDLGRRCSRERRTKGDLRTRYVGINVQNVRGRREKPNFVLSFVLDAWGKEAAIRLGKGIEKARHSALASESI